MATPKLTPEFQTQLRDLAATWGKSAAKRLVGELGSDLPIDSDDIENFATLTAASVTEGAIATLLEHNLISSKSPWFSIPSSPANWQ